jgi:hypothetical protein
MKGLEKAFITEYLTNLILMLFLWQNQEIWDDNFVCHSLLGSYTSFAFITPSNTNNKTVN